MNKYSDVYIYVSAYSVYRRVCVNSRIPNFYSQVLNVAIHVRLIDERTSQAGFFCLSYYENKESLFHTRFNVLSMLASLVRRASYAWCFNNILLLLWWLMLTLHYSNIFFLSLAIEYFSQSSFV